MRETGTYRVLPGRDDNELLLLDPETADPTYVPADSAPDLDVGNRVEATLEWSDEGPSVVESMVEEATRFRFRRTDEPIFQAARECFDAARDAGEAMNARVTYSTDNEANGVVYTFADQPGERDLFADFREGRRPLDPLVERAAESADPPFSVWVLDPADAPFVVVYIVLDPDGILEETMRDTYG